MSNKEQYADFIREGILMGMTDEELHDELNLYIDDIRQESQMNEKKKDMRELADCCEKYLSKYYPSLAEDKKKITDEQVESYIKFFDDIFNPLINIMNAISKESEEEEKVVEEPKKNFFSDDDIANFIDVILGKI